MTNESKTVFRLDENNQANLRSDIAAKALILFGPLAEDGLTVAMNDAKNGSFSSVIIAKRAASLLKLPEKMNSCFIKYRYPTKYMGGLSAADNDAVEAWRVYFNNELREAITKKVSKVALWRLFPMDRRS